MSEFDFPAFQPSSGNNRDIYGSNVIDVLKPVQLGENDLTGDMSNFWSSFVLPNNIGSTIKIKQILIIKLNTNVNLFILISRPIDGRRYVSIY